MKKLWKRLKKKWSRAVDRFVSDEEGVGVVEIILILVDILTTQNPCGYCGLCWKRGLREGF